MISALPEISTPIQSSRVVEIIAGSGLVSDCGLHAWTVIRNEAALPLPCQAELSALGEIAGTSEVLDPAVTEWVVSLIASYGWTVADDWTQDGCRHVRMSPKGVV